MVTIPHSGEKVPDSAPWLKGLPEPVLMCDVDRYVDRLYEPSLEALKIPFVKTEWHRYCGDLNRLPTDVDPTSVIGNSNKPGSFNRGFLWTITTTDIPLMKAPVSADVHRRLVDLVYEPFHANVRNLAANLKAKSDVVYHIDAHSMPSVGTRQHRDPGERRADIVVSDCFGKSSGPWFRDTVIAAYVVAGFKVGYNWPYFGGRLSEQYGNPAGGHETIQVELNRDLYMDEVTKAYRPDQAAKVQEKIRAALTAIQKALHA